MGDILKTPIIEEVEQSFLDSSCEAELQGYKALFKALGQ